MARRFFRIRRFGTFFGKFYARKSTCLYAHNRWMKELLRWIAWLREPRLEIIDPNPGQLGKVRKTTRRRSHTDTLDESVCRLTGTDILLPPIPGLPSTHLKPNPISYPPYPSAFRSHLEFTELFYPPCSLCSLTLLLLNLSTNCSLFSISLFSLSSVVIIQW